VVEKVVSYGANLIPFPYVDKSTVTRNGITYTINEDGSITANGTATGGSYFMLCKNIVWHTDYVDGHAKPVAAGGKTYTDCMFNPVNNVLSINIVSGVTVSNKTYYPMVNLGTTAAEYKPFREPITYEIPEELRGTGKGIEGYADTMDFERGKDIKKCETYVFTGNEIWSNGGNGRIFIGDANSPLKKPCVADKAICNQYDLVPYTSIVSAPFGSFCIREGGGVQFKTHHEDHEKWSAYLAERYASGNPVTLTYAPAEPIETDLPETFSNLIEVEGGGVLEFANTSNDAVPSHISYLRRIV
jgi:hypothetical protein